MLARRWRIRASEPGAWENLSRALGVSALVARVLAARGFRPGPEAEAFLRPRLASLPDPFGIPGMGAAAERVARAVETREPLWVYTDYDVDGVTSAALLAEFLEACGAEVHCRLPRRDREGYGLKVEPLEEMAAAGARVVVTADCGIRAVDAARRARELGVDLVITDHHTPGPELPPATALVNPRLTGGEYPEPAPAGVGVAWNLAAAVRSVLRAHGHFASRPEPDLRVWLDLVAVGTVADMVPLRGVNRVFVAAGLGLCNPPRRPGLRAMASVAGLRPPLTAGNLGFHIGPRLNAAGRMEGPRAALDLLRAASSAEAVEHARVLDGLNRQRQAEERSAVAAARQRVEKEGWWPGRYGFVLEGDDWHPGVVGLVASRLVEAFHRPTVVLVPQGATLKGSARSIPGLHLVEALEDCRDLLVRYGGHAAAAGLELEPGALGAFRARFEEVVRSRVGEEDLVPVLEADAEVALSELNDQTVAELGCLEPFGVGNPRPVFVLRGVEVVSERPLGASGDHRALVVAQGGARREAVVWRVPESWGFLRPGTRVDLVATAGLHTWNGRTTVRLTVKDAHPAG
ncbi:single-stranded-DNA-specific exonuclease RecJ [Deferrisoma camini]|uniref:single-stranded-DNA-specific exonuclease RecJ n=1 Tax=Deferrisoma camini TaxID=1035120 RepID=UPI00046D7C55|nr:single-stranded-DNA-specific exonuclease RecJ [Deferrisoma camini]